MIWTDSISYDPATVDEWGRPVSTMPIPVLARVEWIDELVRDQEGKLRTANLLIGIPAGTAVDFSSGGKVQILRLRGQNANDPRWYEVLSVFIAGGLSSTHTELRCG